MDDERNKVAEGERAVLPAGADARARAKESEGGPRRDADGAAADPPWQGSEAEGRRAGAEAGDTVLSAASDDAPADEHKVGTPIPAQSDPKRPGPV